MEDNLAFLTVGLDVDTWQVQEMIADTAARLTGESDALRTRYEHRQRSSCLFLSFPCGRMTPEAAGYM